MIDRLRKALEALDIDDPFFGTRWEEQTGTYCSYKDCDFTHQGGGHNPECPVTVMRKLLHESVDEAREAVFGAIQKTLGKHRVIWHGGGTGVAVSCRCMHWSGEKVRNLDEAYAVHDKHITCHIIKALDGEE